MQKAERVFKPSWLQLRLKNYIKSLFEKSKYAVDKQAKGGHQHCNLDVASTTVNNVCCDLILASDPLTKVKRKLNLPQYEILSSLFHKYRPYPNEVPLRIIGRVVLMSHHWRDVTLINKAKKRFGCEHRNPKCECAQFALKDITRPYKVIQYSNLT